jgi:hypothetical protein
MKYITDQIRYKTGRMDIAFIGEPCGLDEGRYRYMGFNAGTGGPDAGTRGNIKNNAQNQQSWTYAAGVTVSSDNDTSRSTFDNKTNDYGRVRNALFGCEKNLKLPVFMTMDNLWPLNEGTSTHDFQVQALNFADPNDWTGTAVSHWSNLFQHDMAYTTDVMKLFEGAIRNGANVCKKWDLNN